MEKLLCGFFFLECETSEKDPEFKFSCQNLSLERIFFSNYIGDQLAGLVVIICKSYR